MQLHRVLYCCRGTINTEEIAKALYPSLKQEVVVQLDLGAPEKVQGESAEVHKDKDAMRTLLVTLSGDEARRRVVYGEEGEVHP